MGRDPDLARDHRGDNAVLQPGAAPEPEQRRRAHRARPVLFIYGEHDQANVRELTPGYYANAGKPKAIWEVPGASHTGGIDARPRAYEHRIVAFFDHALLEPRASQGRGSAPMPSPGSSIESEDA